MKKTGYFFLLLLMGMLFCIDKIQAQNVKTQSQTKKGQLQSVSNGDTLYIGRTETVSEPVNLDVLDGVDQPEYKGGLSEMFKFIAQNMKYPEDAVDEGIEGRVVVRFTVTKDGQIKNVEIVRPLYPSCNAEAIRIVSMMTDWIPGKIDGKPADIQQVIPFVFRLPQ